MKDASLLNHSSQNCPHIQCHPRTVEVLLEMKDASLLNHTSQIRPHLQCHPRTVEVLLEMKDASLLNQLQPKLSPYTVPSEDSGSSAGDERRKSSEPQPESSPYTVPSEDSGSAAGDERRESSEPQQPESSPYTVPSEDSGSAAGDERRESSEPQQPKLSPYTVPSEDSGSAAGDERCESPGQDITGSNRFAKRCNAIISNAPLDKHGEVNVYQCKGLIDHLKKYVLPFAGLWTGIMLGDLGRHGTGPQYKQCSRRYNALRKLTRQNITQDNKTQGVMEKSQWDLKHIRFTSGRLTRLDDFVAQYRISHTALLKEYEDSERVFRRKTYRVEKEIWKEKQQKKRGRYVSAIPKPFHFKTSKKKSSVSEGPIGKQISPPQLRSSLEGDHENIVDNKAKTTATPQDQVRILSFIKCSYS
ncbi:uncharacterized protein LOC132112707 isoform X31 [Carassius carassius]|uniref:uncharacterized protein LOC132112707 isoform X31 n=1 Tax=Carassius carassius TaxID=217509 RepID=UPI002869436A|nr:uncharacterized protein LOC132112707 isoform X31 [Carassius carassius]